MEKKYLIESVIKLLRECTDLETLYLIKSLLSVKR